MMALSWFQSVSKCLTGNLARFAPAPSPDVSWQLATFDGISDGILAPNLNPTYVGQWVAARLNIIARYVERMLSASQDGYNSLK